MPNDDFIKRLFQSIDDKNAKAFAGFITDTGQFRYASYPAAQGREAIENFVAGFFSTLKSLSHSKLQSWTVDDGKTMFVSGEVNYTLLNDAQVSIPFLNHFTMVGDKIEDYLVYTDPSPMAVAAG